MPLTNAKIAELRAVAEDMAKDSIVTQALARLVEQVLTEIHETRIAPLLARINDMEREHQEFRLQNDREWRAKLDHVKKAARRPLSSPEGPK